MNFYYFELSSSNNCSRWGSIIIVNKSQSSFSKYVNNCACLEDIIAACSPPHKKNPMFYWGLVVCINHFYILIFLFSAFCDVNTDMTDYIKKYVKGLRPTESDAVLNGMYIQSVNPKLLL